VRVAGAQAAVQLAAPDGEPDPDRAAALQRHLLKRGILAYGGGRASDCLMLVPPINIPADVLAIALDSVVEGILELGSSCSGGANGHAGQ
jgi:4-aminobutyrate aminotransferase-like enzyme